MFIAALLCSCNSFPQANLHRYEAEQPQMGIPFRIVLYAPSDAVAEAAINAAFARIKALNQIFSDYENTSELTALNRTAGQGKVVPVSKELWEVLCLSQEMAERSNGAFDVTVGPYVTLWRRARRIHQLPAPDKLAAAREVVGYKNLRLYPKQRAVEITKAGARIDLGGIAKGYAVDEALKVLSSHGIRSAMVAGSGDLAVSGPPPGKQGWRIEIAPHEAGDASTGCFVSLKNQALATSGDVFQHVEIENRRYSHIVDPRTGSGLTDFGLVTVIAKNCATADSLATAISVLGPVDGLKLADSQKAVARIARKPADKLEIIMSEGFQRFIVP